MTTPEAHPGVTVPDSPRGCAGPLLQWMLSLLVALIVLGTGLWLGTRSRSFQGWVMDRLEERTGVEWTAEGAQVQWPCDVVCFNLVMRGPQGGGGGSIAVQRLRVGWRARGALELELDRPRVVMEKGAGAEWQPRFLEPLALLGRVEDLPALFGQERQDIHLTIRDGMLGRDDRATGRRLEEIEGLDFETLPVSIPDGVIRYYALRVRRLLGPEHELLGAELQRVWFSMAGCDYVEVKYKGWTDASRREYGFWRRPDAVKTAP